MAELHKFIEDQIEDGLRGFYVAPSYEKGKMSLYISVGDEKFFNGNVTWRDFIEVCLDSDTDLLEKFLPEVEKLVRALKATIKVRRRE